MKTSSAKAKGRRLQQQVAEEIIKAFPDLNENDVRSIPMGSQGCDVWLSSYGRKLFPFAVECKNVEKINIWSAWEQAKTHAANEGLSPLVVFSRNREDVLVTLRFEDLLEHLTKTKT